LEKDEFSKRKNQMTKDEITRLLASAKYTTVSLDPNVKDHITKRQLDDVTRSARSHLSARKKVHLVVVRE